MAQVISIVPDPLISLSPRPSAQSQTRQLPCPEIVILPESMVKIVAGVLMPFFWDHSW